MNKIVKYGFIDSIPNYNCGAHSSKEWSQLDGVPHPILGSFDIAFGVTTILLYIPILSVMFQAELYKMSCFKIMICLGIIDMLALCINSVLTGFFAIKGAVYCTYPRLTYISGMTVLGLWCCSCIIVVILVVNRLMDLSEHKWRTIFYGNLAFLVMLAPVIYGVYFSIFTNPALFNSKYYIWIFNPMISDEKTKYLNIPHSINNVLIVAVTCALYVWLYIEVKKKLIEINWTNRRNDLSFQILVQSAMICSINLVASIIFVVMNFIELPIWLTITAQKMWQLIHGAPVIIYLSLNKTIRTSFLKNFKRIKFSFTDNTSVSP